MKGILCLIIMASMGAQAQRITVNGIDDSRSTGDGYFSNLCKVELRISGDEARKYAFARLLSIDKAIDNLGNDLLRNNDSFDNGFKEKEETYFKVPIELNNPSRKAETMQISGTIRLFAPSEANGGLLVAKNIASKAGKNLLPAEAPLSLAFMSKDEVLKYKQENEAKMEEGLSKLPGEMAEGIRELLNVFSGLLNGSETENMIYFMAGGDYEKLVSLQFVDGSGKEVENMGYTRSGGITGYYMKEKIKPDWGIKMSIETTAAVKDLPFSLKELELP